VPFETRDVSVDAEAAREMVTRTRQMGVPVIADAQEAIVGFDMPRLQRMAARHRRGGGLGLKVADASDGPGAYVGGVREDSPGARAGLEVGDVIIELSGRAVSGVDDLEQIAAKRPAGQPTSITIRRNGDTRTLILR
jgi:S1-C subfamily serine protease